MEIAKTNKQDSYYAWYKKETRHIKKARISIIITALIITIIYINQRL